MRSSLAAPVAVLVAGCLTLTACGATPAGSGRSPSPLWSAGSPSPSEATRDEPAATAPLTGEGAAEKDAALPAVAVSVLDDKDGPEPSGLSAADLVYEELSDRGTSHLLAVFQSRSAAKVGPVDITRPVDVKLLPVLRPAYAFAGGPMGFAVQVDKAGIDGVNKLSTPKAFRGAYTSTARVLAHTGEVAAPPRVLSYGDAADPLAEDAKKATGVTIDPPGEPAQVWTWDAADRRWSRTSGRGAEVSVANLVVQRTKYKTVHNENVSGGSTSTALVTGDGSCLAFGPAQQASCTWSRPSRDKQTNYADSSAATLLFQPGPTWVLLAPPGTKVATT